MQLSKKITREYLSRMLLFRNHNQIAEMIGVSRATVHRWDAGQGTPRESLLNNIDDAFNDLLGDLFAKGFPEVADALDFDRPDKHAARMVPIRTVEKWLHDRLHKKPAIDRAYEFILKDASRKGITRGQLYRASLRIGVIKDLKGFGRKKHSVWSLPR